MNLRKQESIRIERATAHILDKHLEEPITAQSEIELTEDITRYLTAHIIKTSRTLKAQAASFVGDGTVKALFERIISYPDCFITESRTLAKLMFAEIKPRENIESCDLIAILYRCEDTQCLALLKLNHQKTFQHSIEPGNEGFFVTLSSIENTLPQAKNQLTAGALICAGDLVSETSLLIVEREGQEDGPRWFMNRYLGAQHTPDRMELTRTFKELPEKFARRHLRQSFENAATLRATLYDELLGSTAVDVKSFIECAVEGAEVREKLVQEFEKAGLLHEQLEIDRSWVNDKVKNRTIKTDTGFVLRASHDLYEDSSKFEIQRNGDGSINYIIKAVRTVGER